MRKFFTFLILFLTPFLLKCVWSQNPKQEVRAVWLTTVFNIDWPGSTSASIQKQQLTGILDKLQDANFNTIVFQVRARGDLTYYSEIEPYCKYITGSLGKDPGYDVLQFVIDECHKRGMEMHAWFVTYKVYDGQSAPPQTEPNHIVNTHPDYCKLWNSGGSYQWWLDPGMPEVRTYLRDVVKEIVGNYNVDGIHFDFIRYPGSDYDDDDTYALYGNGMNKDDWRRQNINEFVYGVYDDVQEINPSVKVSSAPIGIYKSTNNFAGWEGYYDIYQDSRDWMEKEKHDVLFPMIYWDIATDPEFDLVTQDWVENSFGRHVVTGMASYKMSKKRVSKHQEVGDMEAFYMKMWDNKRGWSATEMVNQVKVAREKGAQGQCYFSCKDITNNVKSVRTKLKSDVYQYPANIPPMPWKDNIVPNAPNNLIIAKNSDTEISLSWETPDLPSDGDEVNYYNVYYSTNQSVDVSLAENVISWHVNQNNVIINFDEVPTEDLYFTVTAFDKNYNESTPSNVVHMEKGEVTSLINPEAHIVKMYPVPAKGVLYLDYLQNVERISILNTTGQTVSCINANKFVNGRVVIPVGKLESGVYFVNIKFNSGFVNTKKFVKQ